MIEQLLAPTRQVLRSLLDDWTTLGIWVTLNLASLAVLWWDVRKRNEALAPMMKLVWTLVVAYSGPVGLGIYWYSGRTQIATDSLWKRGFRSTSHCYSGCGLGEVIGITAATIILGFSTLWVTVTTFGLAYTFGFAFTVGPLVQQGVGFREAIFDGILSESPSITIMEVAAIGTDLYLAGEASWRGPLFWTALFFSLTLGFVVAYPVNVLLIEFGVKEGMGNPAEMDGGAGE